MRKNIFFIKTLFLGITVFAFFSCEDDVMDLATVQTSTILAKGVMYVNCPVVYVED